MSSIKDFFVDILVLGLIISLLFFESDAQIIALWIYTGLLLAGKLAAVFMPGLQRKANKSTTPDWVYHIIYLVSVAILAYLQYYYLTGSWVLIWLMSIITAKKRTDSKS